MNDDNMAVFPLQKCQQVAYLTLSLLFPTAVTLSRVSQTQRCVCVCSTVSAFISLSILNGNTHPTLLQKATVQIVAVVVLTLNDKATIYR